MTFLERMALADFRFLLTTSDHKVALRFTPGVFLADFKPVLTEGVLADVLGVFRASALVGLGVC